MITLKQQVATLNSHYVMLPLEKGGHYTSSTGDLGRSVE